MHDVTNMMYQKLNQSSHFVHNVTTIFKQIHLKKKCLFVHDVTNNISNNKFCGTLYILTLFVQRPPSRTQTTARRWSLRCFSWELILPPFFIAPAAAT